jgi:hypothetical protein
VCQCKEKVLHLEIERSKLSKKLVGLKFNIENRKVFVLKAQNAILQSESQLKWLVHEIQLAKQKVWLTYPF